MTLIANTWFRYFRWNCGYHHGNFVWEKLCICPMK